jgi:glycine/D-amino acid oxidase-like deaminating enzyme
MYDMTKKWDMIVIGGGIIGCSAAYYAAKQGMKPLIIERDNIAAAQSGRPLGLVRCLGRDLLELPMMIEAMEIWRGLEKELGRSIEWRQGGMLVCASDEAQVKGFHHWRELAQEFRLGAQWLSAREIDAVVPGMEHRFLGALNIADDGMADPVMATRAFYDAAMELGAESALGGVVDEIVSAGGIVKGVRIGQQLIESDRVLCAAGAASSKLLKKHGLLFPQDIVRASIMRTEPVKRTIAPAIVAGNIGLRQGGDNSLYVYHTDTTYDVRLDSPRYAWWFKDQLFGDAHQVKINLASRITRKLSIARTSPINDIPASWQAPYPDHKALKKAHRELGELFPEFKGIGVLSQFAGYIDSTPDLLPVIGKVESVDGLLVASGFSGHGFGVGPSVGKRIAELVVTGRADFPKAFSPYRFANGTWREIESTAAF